VEEFLLGFYSKLTFGMSRYTYVASEASPFVGYNTIDGGFVAPDYSCPNSAANADTLQMLRNMLVMEELKDNVETGTLCLMKAMPRAWLEPGKRTSVNNLPTYFGNISFTAEMRADKTIRITIDPPRGDWQRIAISLRRKLDSMTINGASSKSFDAKGQITIPHQNAPVTVEAKPANF
jgi:hypothetical protein